MCTMDGRTDEKKGTISRNRNQKKSTVDGWIDG